ncbi:MAG: glycosyltransferase [Alistipes sp.]|nr:glycosyltransferase [Alistipes sp.]
MYLLEVFKNILKTRPQTKLILLGDGPLRGEIEQAIEKKGLRDKVILRGLKGNVGYYYKNSDLFLFPSLMEGFGNVLIEAQYFSLPVLASGIAPHREAVHTGQHDHLFDLSTSPEEVAVMANAIMDDPDKGYVKEAKEFADGFSIGEMVINLKNIYRGMVDGKETDR